MIEPQPKLPKIPPPRSGLRWWVVLLIVLTPAVLGAALLGVLAYMVLSPRPTTWAELEPLIPAAKVQLCYSAAYLNGNMGDDMEHEYIFTVPQEEDRRCLRNRVHELGKASIHSTDTLESPARIYSSLHPYQEHFPTCTYHYFNMPLPAPVGRFTWMSITLLEGANNYFYLNYTRYP